MLFIQLRARECRGWVWLAGNPVIVEQPEPEIVIKTEYAEIDKNNGGERYAYNGIYLEYSEWIKLAQYAVKKGGVSRDGLIALKISSLGNLKATVGTGTKYQNVLERLGKNGMGWFDGEKLGPPRLTHFCQFLLPRIRPTAPTKKPDSATPTEDDDGRTTGNGGEQ